MPRSYAPPCSSATPVQGPAQPTEQESAAAVTAAIFGPVGGGEDSDFDSVIGGSGEQEEQRRSFDPTILVLAVVGIGVVVGVVLAFKALFSSLETGAPDPRPVATSSSTSAESTEPDEPSDEPSDPESPEVSTAPPVIASAVSFDPSDDDGEHAEAVERAFDGDTSTYWYTQTYQQPNFSGFKDAVGFVMTLEESALVSSVTLQTGADGGKVEIRASDESDPGGGTLLASGAFKKDVTFELETPTETSTLTLWITELPTAADGSFRLELNEIELG
jgi:eukaryotic-like serine/threonine-protein kinase